MKFGFTVVKKRVKGSKAQPNTELQKKSIRFGTSCLELHQCFSILLLIPRIG